MVLPRIELETFCVCRNILKLQRFISSVCPGTLSTLDELNTFRVCASGVFRLSCLQILTRELMLMAIARISNGEIEFAQWICQFVREIHRGTLASVAVPQMEGNYYMKSKTEVMLQRACFSVHSLHQFDHCQVMLVSEGINSIALEIASSVIAGQRYQSYIARGGTSWLSPAIRTPAMP
ncbi:hypothetical protein HID58_076623 [Brassica napus]|uniref:Uncharacterized protein n=1 Tax=Brassica napus TaxID=3708 RepID=A0ABQ7YN37_BRANA|nr:hypothetical protein HID58_076623 [Brassica napus]